MKSKFGFVSSKIQNFGVHDTTIVALLYSLKGSCQAQSSYTKAMEALLGLFGALSSSQRSSLSLGALVGL